jgi:hypothetical protein
MPTYHNEPFRGCRFAGSSGDGYTVILRWYKAVPVPNDYILAYNIYYSTNRDEVFSEDVKFMVPDATRDTVSVTGLRPGDVYYFAVRATEFEPGTVNLNQLPATGPCRVYPEAALRFNITDESLRIPIQDADQFPALGVVQIGAELIQYSSLDIADGYLILSDIDQRGVYNTEARLHTVDGYDGYRTYDNPFVRFFKGFEDDNGAVVLEENKFEFPNYPRTDADGYKDRVDVVNKDYTPIDEANDDFKHWDQTGWRRTHPADMLAGKCIGSYYGGEHFCADGYEGVGRQVRGLSFQDHMNQREELLLETDGRPCMLFKRQWEGKVSNTYINHRENTAHRGLDNYGTSMVHGYEQFFNSRRSDGKIMVRFGPTKEDIKRNEEGLENEFIPNCWTLVYPSIKDGDFIIRYDLNGAEEFRYEIIDVERNDTVLEGTGAQKFTAVRVRKTDPIYQVRAIHDTATMPEELSTSIGMVSGPGGIPPHIHMIKINENITVVDQVNQTTSLMQGHNHPVVSGVVQEVLGHTHTIVLP